MKPLLSLSHLLNVGYLCQNGLVESLELTDHGFCRVLEIVNHHVQKYFVGLDLARQSDNIRLQLTNLLLRVLARS